MSSTCTPATTWTDSQQNTVCLCPRANLGRGHSPPPLTRLQFDTCINSDLILDAFPGTGLAALQGPPPRDGHCIDFANGLHHEAPPTGGSWPPTVTCLATDGMTGHDDLCYCNDCEPDNTILDTLLDNQDHVPTDSSPLHTGWPLAAFSQPQDLFTSRCLHIYDLVRESGAPNFLLARIPLPHQLDIARWRSYLNGHSDVALVDYLQFGFPVGFHPSHPLQSSVRNHGSATLYPDDIQKYLDKEVSCQAMLGPFTTTPFWPWCHLNPLMSRPKKDSTDRRVILDLSWPSHASVNGGTPLEIYMDEPYKLLLPTVDDFAQILAVYGRGSFMWTLDLRRAFRQLRIDPLDWPLICIAWQGNYYVDVSVAFGVRHGAAFTQRVSQAVCDILEQENIITLPYIDDYIGSQPSQALAVASYERSLQLFAELGLDLHPAKCVPPTRVITWIGVTYDSEQMTMCIPAKVIADTKCLVATWLTKCRATRHELQVILGKLFHAGKCCPAARLFVGRMLDTLRAAPPSGPTNLSPNFRADLHWWHDLLPHYNGRLLIQLTRPTFHVHIDLHDPTVTIHTDTRTTTATLPRSVATTDHKWAHRECFALLVALQLWGSQWAEAELLIHCVDPDKLRVLVHGRTRNDAILATARRIWYITARQDIRLSPTPLQARLTTHTVAVSPPVLDFL